jgi:hypothetical protein
MIIKLPALVADQEFAMVNWQKIYSYGLRPVKIRIRIERKWDKKKVKNVIPKEIMPPGAPRTHLIMTKYPKGAMECKALVPLDPKNPRAIKQLFKFVTKKYPQNDWYVMDIWFLNEREGRFQGSLLEFHLTTIQKDPKLGNIKGLRLNAIDDVPVLEVEASADELENADNGYADDNCKVAPGKPELEPAKLIPKCKF